ncbi:uncharacterized protein LOC110987024 [Acanthaster planci]|uniref:Uncharacterized protein LOC110987024 n=1 Tax=Acanthaster planci TaxID=133434 RepID=A0A8B7ZJP8_ACAPL|nr:uncharacterized protein LOC110987024 [Acanthaster planci]XP_022105105.1 uncharacterized protein LOC110987024 [Acanthaster planci]
MDNGVASLDLNNTVQNTLTTPASGAALKPEHLIEIVAAIETFLIFLVGLLVFLFGNGIVKCKKKTPTGGQTQTTDSTYSAVTMDQPNEGAQQPQSVETDQPDGVPSLGAPQAAGGGSADSRRVASTSDTSKSSPNSQGSASHSAVGNLVKELEIDGENCPFLGKVQHSKFRFESDGAQEMAQGNEADSTREQGPSRTEPPNASGLRKSAGPGGGDARGASRGTAGVTIGRMKVSGVNCPVMTEVKNSEFTFTSSSRKK